MRGVTTHSKRSLTWYTSYLAAAFAFLGDSADRLSSRTGMSSRVARRVGDDERSTSAGASAERASTLANSASTIG